MSAVDVGWFLVPRRTPVGGPVAVPVGGPMSAVEGADAAAALRARLEEPLHGYASRWSQEIYALREAVTAVLDLCDFSATVEVIGFDGERYIPSAAIRAAIAEHIGGTP